MDRSLKINSCTHRWIWLIGRIKCQWKLTGNSERLDGSPINSGLAKHELMIVVKYIIYSRILIIFQLG